MKENVLVVNGVEYVPKDSIVSMAKPDKKGLEYCIIRTYSAGVWAGWIDTKSKDLCQEVKDARRLWRWWSQFTLSELAVLGIKKGKESENQFAISVPKVILKQVIEIIPCSEEAMEQLQNHPSKE
jgi:predicted aldo/keto reductase-like oxidoreductase